MGVYRAAIVTENGQNLIAQALANEKPLIFTSAKTSSYSYPVGTDVPALTGLQDVVQSVLPFDSKVLGGNVAQVSVRFDNDGVDQTYRIETIGLYAKIEGGAEILFSVTQATTPDEMPVQSDISPSAYIYNIQHTVQNASQITLTVNPAGTATVQDIMDIETPEFDDSGTVEGISSFPSFLETMKSKMNFFQFFRNLKAGLQFVLHAGQIVNNCVTDNAGLPLSAAQGKALMDKYTQLYSDLNTTNNNLSKLNGKMLGSNYVMNYSDFSDLSVNVYSVETFATTPSGNAPENNVGDFRITRLGMNNSKYNTLILTSPRYKTSVSMSQEFYVGNFWDGIWMGWERLANKSALDNLTSLYNTTKANYEKGSTFLDDISPLSFPSQLKHAGFYKLPTMTADVNADAGSETMTEYTTGDFYGLLLGEDINTTDGCVYGTLIVSSPRIKSAIWVGNIWQKKFISWYKIGKS